MKQTSSPLPLLRFSPIYQHPIWGGHRIRQHFARGADNAEPIGESWEIFDLPGHASVVEAGPFAGQSLSSLVAQYPQALLGAATAKEGLFPLMVKFIDAHQTLSVQVHPDSQTAWQIGQNAQPKTEAWYIIDCEPDAVLYVGFEGLVSAKAFKAAAIAGTLERYLRKVAVRHGDFVFVPAGTVHAIGSGILLAEIQQPSDTTYRLFDLHRVDAAVHPRELHIAQAMRSIHYKASHSEMPDPPASGRPGLSCRSFAIEKWALTPSEAPAQMDEDGDVPLILLAVSGSGQLRVESGEHAETLRAGGCLLVPACLRGAVRVNAIAGDISFLLIRPGH